MVVLRLGGVYADVDTECRQPMDGLIRPRDTMVVGWENEFMSPAEAEHRHYVRSRQASTRDPGPPLYPTHPRSNGGSLDRGGWIVRALTGPVPGVGPLVGDNQLGLGVAGACASALAWVA